MKIKDIFRRLKKQIELKKYINKRNITAAAICFAVIIGAMVYYAVNAVVTRDDSEKIYRSGNALITRMPILRSDFSFEPITESGILLSWHDNSIKLEESEETQLKLGAVIYPLTLEDRTLTYKSSNEEVASVDGDGNITVKNPGSVEITVSNEFTGKEAKAYLQVILPVNGLVLEKSTITMSMTDKGVRIGSMVMPENASNTAIQWYSKDTDIVEVDQFGGLTPKNTGLTEVVATTTDGGFSAKCFVTVINEVIKAESVIIQNKEEITLKTGETWLAAVSVLPANARNRLVSWFSDNESVARVSANGKVTAVGAGTATITAMSSDGPSDTMQIKVAAGTSGSSGGGLSISTSSSSKSGVTYVTYPRTLEEMAKLMLNSDQPPKITVNGSYQYASIDETMKRLDPNEYIAGGYKYQFMDLGATNGLSADDLNKYLEGKGILSGQGEAFIEAANRYNISEIYLVAHACLETGNGSSALANGITVNGTTVYNMFGIGAYDSDAVGYGSQRAYSEGWTSPEAAIIGGAAWISENYINASGGRQNTLYKMRWNPDNPGVHMYATSGDWAIEQGLIMERMISQFPAASISYEIPVYEGSNAAVVE